jgi:hypothetical protein
LGGVRTTKLGPLSGGGRSLLCPLPRQEHDRSSRLEGAKHEALRIDLRDLSLPEAAGKALGHVAGTPGGTPSGNFLLSPLEELMRHSRRCLGPSLSCCIERLLSDSPRSPRPFRVFQPRAWRKNAEDQRGDGPSDPRSLSKHLTSTLQGSRHQVSALIFTEREEYSDGELASRCPMDARRDSDSWAIFRPASPLGSGAKWPSAAGRGSGPDATRQHLGVGRSGCSAGMIDGASPAASRVHFGTVLVPRSSTERITPGPVPATFSRRAAVVTRPSTGQSCPPSRRAFRPWW